MKKTTIKVQTNKGVYEISVSNKYNETVEKNYGDETPFSQEELTALKESIRNYPAGGLGECLVKTNNKRGFKRDPNYSKFTNQRSTGDLRCPVLVLKEDFGKEISFKEHLLQFRRIRNHISQKLGLDLKNARYFYNYMLSNKPKELSELI